MALSSSRDTMILNNQEQCKPITKTYIDHTFNKKS